MQSAPIIYLLMTGNELMSGDTVDSNSSMIAQELSVSGFRVNRKVTVGDDPKQLKQAIREACDEADLLIVNGGLGPTSDDLTAELTAEVAGLPIEQNPIALAHVEAWCARRGVAPNRANLKQSYLPQSCSIVHNPMGSAVGFNLAINGCLVITTPGVPSELRAMLPEIHQLALERFGGQTGSILRLQTFGLGESSVEQLLDEDDFEWPETVELGFRAGAPQLELKLAITDQQHRGDQVACYERLQHLFGDHIIGEGETTLARAVIDELSLLGKTVVTAESCTGGLIASMITKEPGSSASFHAGFVTYSNQMKHELLGVSLEDLETHGAVSEPVVQQMLQGALARAKADIGVAVSGIAGPDGGTPDKPVGTVWIAWGTATNMQTRRLVIPVKRTLFQTMVAAAGLDLIRRQLKGLPPVPHYFNRRAA